MKTCSRFRGVVVITSALHADGPRFDPGRESPGKGASVQSEAIAYLDWRGRASTSLRNGALRMIMNDLSQTDKHAHHVSYAPNGARYSLENLGRDVPRDM